MSDRGLPISPMHMNGNGRHTYSLLNAKGERFWVVKTLGSCNLG